MKDKNITVHSPNFFEWLALLFIGLRLAGIITWPWVWVLAPLWLPACLVIIIACIVVLCGKWESGDMKKHGDNCYRHLSVRADSSGHRIVRVPVYDRVANVLC